MQDFDDIAHFMLQLAQQQNQPRLIGFGHVTSYDPKRHLVKLVLPTFPVADPQTGAVSANPIISPWMQLGTPWAGAGWGFQGAPQVGGTGPNNFGTQCAVFAVDNRSSVSFSACMFYTNDELAPDATLLPGEAAITHSSGTVAKFHNDGSFTITQASGSEINMESSGQIAVTLPNGEILSVNGTSDALALVSKLVSAFNAHTHGGVQTGGGTSGTPSSTWSASTIQSSLVKVAS